MYLSYICVYLSNAKRVVLINDSCSFFCARLSKYSQCWTEKVVGDLRAVTLLLALLQYDQYLEEQSKHE